MIKVVHIMSDGKVLNDIQGITVPFTKETESAYRLLATYKLNKKNLKKGEKNK